VSPHALLPPLARENFTPLIAQELERVAAGRPMEGGIDLERYDPAASSDLVAAYSSAVHLSTRLTNLSLLAEFGKNAWLLHNSQLEELLKKEEEKLMALRTEVEVCNKERKGAQVDVQGEMKRLEERWKKAVGRVLEVELATEGLRREILEKQRAGAR